MTYSISDLEQLSGIQSHTIRIWEQRYHALQPTRSKGNTRLYDDRQLKKLLNIASLNQSGLKISKICSLSESDVENLLEKQIQSIPHHHNFEYYVTQLVKYGLSYDEISFDKLLTNCINKFGIKSSYQNIMYPILIRLGLMWRKDDICPAQEHFLSNIIKRKIYIAIDGVEMPVDFTKTWLLFLPEDEDHEIGLLFAHYILKSAGYNVIFLGSKVPLSSLMNVINEKEIDHILFFLVRSRPQKYVQNYINELEKITTNIQLHVAGNSHLISQLKLNKNISTFKSLEDFENNIQSSVSA